jgi:transcriptional regulator of aroF, aroG, tyrA and aromatic amino acid transport
MNLKLELIFKDRVGIVADISTTIARQGGNIISMEVVRCEDRAHVYLEAENHEQKARIEEIIEILDQHFAPGRKRKPLSGGVGQHQ